MITWTDHDTWADAVSEAVAGETLTVDERLVVSPSSGRLRLDFPETSATEGEYVVQGQVVACVLAPGGEFVPIHSPFAGWVMGFLAPDGAPVRPAEPILWLRRI